jgi:hypothetical protein
MKRLFLALTTALVSAALLAGTGTAGDTKGPPCTNIVDGTAAYVYDADQIGRVGVAFTLKAPACAAATYAVDIYDLGGTELLVNELAPTSVSGDAVTFSYSFDAGEGPSDGVCIVAETYFKGRLADRGPDSGCFPAPANESPASGYH